MNASSRRRRLRKAPRWIRRLASAGEIAAVSVFVVALALSLPVVLPFVAWSMKRDRKRMMKVTESQTCVCCSQVLGSQSIRRADEVWAAHWKTERDANPERRYRIVRRLHAICTICGQRYSYDERSQTFVSLKSDDM